jgi:ferrochelatase
MAYQIEPSYTHGTPEKTAILLVNLGTPNAPTAQAVRPYLKEFLSDPRVVEIPKAVWWLILNGIILNVRPKKSAAKYATVWMPEGSPLRVYTERQAHLLEGHLSQRTQAPFVVEYAMSYGNPSIASVMQKLKAQNCTRHRHRVRPCFRRRADHAQHTSHTHDQTFP